MASHFIPTARGYSAIYRHNETNHCPGCGRTHWLVGRVTAECAFCCTALPLEDNSRASAPTIKALGKGGGKISRMAFA